MLHKIGYFLLCFTYSNLLVAQHWVVQTTPSQNHTHASVTAPFLIDFSEAIDFQSVESSVVAYGQQSGYFSLIFSYNETTQQLSATPNPVPQFGEPIFISISEGLQNTDGVFMPTPFTWTFLTETKISTGNLTLQPPISTPNTPYALTTGDFNGDGFPDLATVNRGVGNMSVFLNDGTGIVSLAQSLSANTSPEGLSAGDFDQDGDTDIAVISNGMSSTLIFVNDGTGVFTAGQSISVGTSPHGINQGDLDGDGDIDLVVANFNSASLSILENDGSGNFLQTTAVNAGTLPEFPIVKDFDLDGDLDLASPGFTGGAVYTFDNDGFGDFSSQFVLAVGANPHIPLSGDWDNDGFEDLIVPSTGSNSFTILKNEGNTFTGTTVALAGSPWGGIAFDLEGDGDLDAAINSYGVGSVTIFENDGIGNFTNVNSYNVGNQPHYMVSADFNQDGAADLAVCNDASNTIRILLNEVVTDLTEAEAKVDFRLKATPNPFSQYTVLTYELPESALIDITVFDILGQQVQTLFRGIQSQGSHLVEWSGMSSHGVKLPRGMYFCKMTIGEVETVVRVILQGSN